MAGSQKMDRAKRSCAISVYWNARKTVFLPELEATSWIRTGRFSWESMARVEAGSLMTLRENCLSRYSTFLIQSVAIGAGNFDIGSRKITSLS
jgi:hypothetical protein